MNTTTSPVHDNRIFAPRNRMFGPEARMFSPASTSRTSSPARLAGHSPGLARPGVGWLRRP